jgi:asparagine synthase (glutamine-hydrolysing)
MCGIAGIVHNDGRPCEAELGLALEAMRHRGPDARGVLDIDGAAAFAHTRLSIIDVDPRSNQPFRDPTGRYTLTYNGEVYNFAALKTELSARGHAFSTTSDTEVVIHAFAEWSERAFDRFDGMFALGIWDKVERRLVLARDRFGEKPLYWSLRPDGALVFASELRALERSGLVAPKPPSVAAMNHYLALGYILAPLSAHPDVSKLPPATWLSFKPGGAPQTQRYWDYAEAFRQPASSLSFEDAADTVARHLDAAVGSRMVADVPVGSFLSGGLDSSIVTAVARKHVPYELHTFSVGFESPTYDESSDALRVARHLATIHHDVKLTTAGGAERARLASLVYDEPFADTSLVPMVEVAREASKRVRVVLSGDGADEIFAGYPTYQADRVMSVLAWAPAGPRRYLSNGVRRVFSDAMPGKTSLGFKARQFARGLPLDRARAHYAWREINDDDDRTSILGREHADEVRDTAPVRAFLSHYDRVPDLSPLAQHLYVDAMTWLPDDILVKVDRATMASSIEGRAPFLARELVEYVAALPDHFKLGLRRGKRVLRSAARRLLPAATLEKPKAGFSAPINEWLGTSGDNEYREFNRRVIAWRRAEAAA